MKSNTTGNGKIITGNFLINIYIYKYIYICLCTVVAYCCLYCLSYCWSILLCAEKQWKANNTRSDAYNSLSLPTRVRNFSVCVCMCAKCIQANNKCECECVKYAIHYSILYIANKFVVHTTTLLLFTIFGVI